MFLRKLNSSVKIHLDIKKYSDVIIDELNSLHTIDKIEQIEPPDVALFAFNKALDILEKLAAVPERCFAIKVSWRFENILFSSFDEIAKGEIIFGPICEFNREYFDKKLELALKYFNSDFQYTLRKTRKRTGERTKFYLRLTITPYLSVHPGNKRRKIATVSCTMYMQEVELF